MDSKDELIKYLEEQKEKNNRIKALENVEVIKIYEICFASFINLEIVYKKDSIEKIVTIKPQCHFGPMHEGCWYEFGLEPFDKNKTLSSMLSNVAFIETTRTYLKDIYNGAYTDLEIVYRDKQGERHTFLFHSCEHEDDYEVHDVKLLKNVKSTYKLRKEYKG